MDRSKPPLSAKEHAQRVKPLVRADLLAGQSQKETAEKYGVSEKTVGTWAKDWKVDELKEVLSFGPEQYTAHAYGILAELTDMLNTASQENRVSDVNKIADSISKVMKTIEQVTGLTIGQMYYVLVDYNTWVDDRDSDTAKANADLIIDFLTEKNTTMEMYKLTT